MLYLGCHLSSSGGFAAMCRTAHSIDANTFQFFTRNPRGGAAKAIDPADAQTLTDAQAAGALGPVIAHAPYTVNPCSQTEKTREFAVQTLSDDLRRLEYTPGNLYNFHPGSHVGQGAETGIALIAQALDQAMFPGQRTLVLLETMSGKGTELGGRFEELREIIDRCAMPEAVGVCLDTCHVHDAGYDLVHDLDGVLTEFDRVIGLSRLKALHLNDSKIRAARTRIGTRSSAAERSGWRHSCASPRIRRCAAFRWCWRRRTSFPATRRRSRCCAKSVNKL